ncbi:MAG: hypothetical protein IT236_17410 [Bacteroidia bacterium]|nr:hypothetical protein [Bacteroidia bacterium]
MKPIQKNISDFISENKVANICFVDKDGRPYCISCFYVFDELAQALVFKSSYGTTHDAFVKSGASVAGTVIPEAINVLTLKGIQFNGTLLDNSEIEKLKLSTLYIKSFPMSLAMPGYHWAVKLSFLKYTDNSVGFGNKTLWNEG